jgi:hypothetical protein
MKRWINLLAGETDAVPAAEQPPVVAAPLPHESLGVNFGDAAEAATHALGRKLQSIAKDVAGKSGGALGVASGAVALGLDRSGRFLESEGLQGAIKGVSEQMKRNPIPFLLVGIGLGYFVGRHSKSRES